ncbi:MAG: T9SS type A sorting domain-containing protein [Crocinitomicaceae bacterium]|nr:T9SS type A sorting domain-containing protein [Crocinitomicaceae bacterium]
MKSSIYSPINATSMGTYFRRWISILCFVVIGLPIHSQIISVVSYQKISNFEGNLLPVLAGGDQFGGDVTEIGDLNDDGIVDFASYAGGDDTGGNLKGALYILFMNSDGTVNHQQKISDLDGNFTFALQAEDRFGGDIAALGDLDGDGVEDIAVGIPNDHNASGANRGAIVILFMNTDGTVDHYSLIHKNTGYQGGGGVAGLQVNGYFGAQMDAIGDLNNDGVVDLVVGVANRDNTATDDGEVRILFMNTLGKVIADQKISVGNGNFTGLLEAGDRFGQSVSNIGDLNDDGINDIVVGAKGDDDGGTNRGAVWILFMNTDGTVNHHQKISNTEGNFTGVLDNNDEYGGAVSDMGDYDGDGVEDIQVGAPLDDDGVGFNHGATYILFLDTDGTVKSHQKISSLSPGFTTPLEQNDWFGGAVDFIGDLNGDGYGDIVVAAAHDGDGGVFAGALYVIFLELIATPLPVELLEFNATMNYENRSVDLDWTTAAEINNDYFTVERSKDGYNWEGLFSVQGAGNSTSMNSYSGLDYDPQFGVSYYRLKQTDYNGDYKYSNPVSVVRLDGSGTSNHYIYPNPATNALNILVDERPNSRLSISIYSVTGQLVHQQTEISSYGTQELKVDLSNLSAGSYMLVLEKFDGQFQRFKFVKSE